MTSLGANIDNSVNNGKGPYVFRISGWIYHWIGSMCPDEGAAPRFLELYIYDTTNEVKNRMDHFGGEHDGGLKKEIVEALGWHLEEIHVTWAHLEKKRTRLRTCTKIHQEVLHTERGDGVAGIKRCRRDLSGDDVWILATTS
nr:helitron helicase-like domain-containing protein [Tanacetum cinerariifolium]